MAEGSQNQQGNDDKSKSDEPRRYEVEYLVRNSRALLSDRPTIVAGALSLSDRQTHTLDQARDLVKTFTSSKRVIDPATGAVAQR